MAAGLTITRGLVINPVGNINFRTHTHCLVNRHINHFPIAVCLASNQCPNYPNKGLIASNMVGVPHLRSDGRGVIRAIFFRIVAAAHHRPTKRQMHQIVGLIVPPRTTPTKRSHTGINQSRIQLLERIPVQPQFFQGIERQRIKQHVTFSDQLFQDLRAFRGMYIEGDTTFAKIVMPKIQTPLRVVLILIEWPKRAGRIPAQRLDLQHISPGPSQQLAAKLAFFISKFEHFHIKEESRHTSHS